MPIAVVCPSCQASLKVPDQLAGKRVKCPKCSRPVAAGLAGAGSAAPQAAALDRIKVTCPACAKVLQAPAEAAGKAVKCPACGQPVRVPVNGAVPVLAAPAKKPIAGHGTPPRETVAKKVPPAKVSPKIEPASNKVQVVLPGDPLEDMFEAEEVPQRYREALREELGKGEEVVWMGRPLMEIRLRKANVGVVIGVVLGVIALGLIGAGIAIGQIIMAIIVGVLVPFSVLFMLARYLVQRFAGSREVYLVTTRRAIIYPVLRSYDRRQLHKKMELRESSYPEGAGSLIFEVDVQIEAKAGMQRPGQKTVEEKRMEYGFMDIADVVAVEKLIRKTILLTKPGKEDEGVEDEAGAEEPVGRAAAEKVEKAPASVQDDNIKPAPGAAGSWLDADEAEETPVRRKKKVSQEAVEASRGLIEDIAVAQRVRDRALNRLDDDEVVLWVGQPLEKLILLRSLLPTIIALAIAVFLAVMAVNQNAWMVWVAAGVFLVAAVVTPIVRRLRARGTLYVLTQRRATVWEPNLIGMMTVCDYTVEKLSRMARRNALFVKGAGDLVFRTLTRITTTDYYAQRRGGGRKHTGSQSQVQTFYWGFLAIAGVAHVEALINENIVEPYLDKIHE